MFKLPIMKKYTVLLVICALCTFVLPNICCAQYDEYYARNIGVSVNTSPKAVLHKLPSSYSEYITDDKVSVIRVREFIDVDYLKNKTIKSPLELRVFGLTNTKKQRDFNAYIVEYNDILWVLDSRYVQNNELLDSQNSKIKKWEKDLQYKNNILSGQKDRLQQKLDSLIAVYLNESSDSLTYYQKLKKRLPFIRDSLVSVEKSKNQELEKKRYDDWYEKQPTSTKRAMDAITITTAKLSYPNSAGGCDYFFTYINKSQKTIKYLYWTGTFYNAVNDPVSCEIRRYYSFKGESTGPIKPGTSGGGCWPCVIYNFSAKTVKLSNITILYMDGSSISIGAADLNRILKYSVEPAPIKTDEIIKKVISDTKCKEKIEIWEARFNNLKEKKFKISVYEDIYKDNTYTPIWNLLQKVQSDLQDIEGEVVRINGEIEEFNKFINFE